MLGKPGFQIEGLHLFPRPRSPAQELKARIYGGIGGETVDWDFFTQRLPAVVCNQTGEDHLQGNAVQRVVGLGCGHGII